MDKEENARRVAAISKAYRGRAKVVRAGADREHQAETDEKTVETEELPKESWKKGDIVDWLLDSGVEVERSDLEELTKAELIEYFIDAES